MEPSVPVSTFSGTVADELERLAITASKIGRLTSEQAVSLLTGLDAAYTRIQELEEGSQSRWLTQTQMNEISAEMRREAPRFLRDLGGAAALRQAREKVQPDSERIWWFLDDWLAQKRRAALRRSLIVLGSLALALLVLGLVYQRFLAPDPKYVARYGYEQSAGQYLLNNDLKSAMIEVDKGLAGAPGDPNLLTLKGVIQDAQGHKDQAAQNFAAAQKGFTNPEEYFVARGQDYAMVNMPKQALADGQAAVQTNPNSAQGYLLIGEAHELLRQYQAALDDYQKAYDAAMKVDQPGLAAVSRQRTGQLMQMMNSQPPEYLTPETTPTQAK